MGTKGKRHRAAMLMEVNLNFINRNIFCSENENEHVGPLRKGKSCSHFLKLSTWMAWLLPKCLQTKLLELLTAYLFTPRHILATFLNYKSKDTPVTI